MASLRRNRTAGIDGTTPKFLYTILKQLDLKSVGSSIDHHIHILSFLKIDWNDVAENLDITNGHAARMRYSRFKQQMEGIQPPPRKPRSGGINKTLKQEKRKPKSKLKVEKPKKEDQIPIKSEPGESASSVYSQVPYTPIKSEQLESTGSLCNQVPENPYALVKTEPVDEGYGNNTGEMSWTSIQPFQAPEEDYSIPRMENDTLDPMTGLVRIKKEPQVKVEPEWDS